MAYTLYRIVHNVCNSKGVTYKHTSKGVNELQVCTTQTPSMVLTRYPICTRLNTTVDIYHNSCNLWILGWYMVIISLGWTHVYFGRLYSLLLIMSLDVLMLYKVHAACCPSTPSVLRCILLLLSLVWHHTDCAFGALQHCLMH